MWGAIIGDIAGSVYEGRGRQIKTKDFEFFNQHGRFTDDSVCTAAVADILMNGRSAVTTLQEWCRQYPRAGYGLWFRNWMRSDSPEPYDSFGNGAAMRVSPAALIHRDDLTLALAATDQITAVTHDHPEGIKGARATVHAIWLALRETRPSAIQAAVSAEYGYDLSRTVDQIRPGYSFDVTCQGTVPEAITCALESTSFEDAIRNAVSLGGDSDTLAAIAGPIAEARHGIPEDVRELAERHYLGDAPDIAATMEKLYARASGGRSS
ncbi:MAG: ADP-ribosylglycohydrolase family protein [Candidatus Latescibacteria bacterium]|nr:ADP-ribosylglycohydrolase family protein [Candidatus Latescibacterota bacterium]